MISDNPDVPVNLVDILASLSPRNKEPVQARVLESWIAKVENDHTTEAAGRLSWLVASTIVAAKLQEILDANDEPSFLLKGGTLLQHKLGLAARATKDLDGIVRGDINDFVIEMDSHFNTPWGPIEFRRSEIEQIAAPDKLIKPRTFKVSLLLRGNTWRIIKVEISADEGCNGVAYERLSAPVLDGLGLPSPDYLVGITMAYQVAQKIHAASGLHTPPEQINERARDVVDLVLLKEFVELVDRVPPESIKAALEDVYNARSAEAELLGRPVREWPPQIQAHDHWGTDYGVASSSVGITLTLTEAVDVVNGWMRSILS